MLQVWPKRFPDGVASYFNSSPTDYSTERGPLKTTPQIYSCDFQRTDPRVRITEDGDTEIIPDDSINDEDLTVFNRGNRG